MKALGFFGDFYHKEEAQHTFFSAAAPGVNWQSVTPLAFDWDQLDHYELVVMAAENRLDPPRSDASWMSAAHENRLVDWVEKGGNLLAFHSGLASYPEGGAYAALAGGSFQFHPVEHPRFRFVPEQIQHPLLAGVEAFELTDEQYFVRRPASGSLLLGKLESADYGTYSAFWCAERGKGRIVGLTPGHTPASLTNPGLIRLASHSISWLSANPQAHRAR